MFKSVFAKYVTAVMLIFVIGFALLLFVMTSIVNNTLSEGRVQTMEIVSGQSAAFLKEKLGECG